LGQQLDALHAPDLAAKADELDHQNQQLTSQLQQAVAARTTSEARITALEQDLAAARTSLRRMIRDENLK
jgi:cell division protein FtsB